MTKQNVIKAEKNKKEKSSVPAVEKAFDVLELLASVPDGLTMNDIVAALGRPMGELYRVVLYLTERGYLSQDPVTDRYSLTLKLFELSHQHDPTERLIQAALPMLQRIAAKSNQSCHLGVHNRDSVLVLASVQSPRPAGYSVRTGALFPVAQTSSGHVILAFSSDEAQSRYIARCRKADRDSIKARLKRIRLDGFEDTESTMIEGVRNLCVPVFNTGGVVGAITCGFVGQLDNTSSADETLTILRNTSIELSQTLGFRLESSPFEAALTD
ncbi:MAG: IclR family transcriptional regulator [Octadecabacter sp.]|nr:IclR family transcriptional regulator [Octadecabacter sp.]